LWPNPDAVDPIAIKVLPLEGHCGGQLHLQLKTQLQLDRMAKEKTKNVTWCLCQFICLADVRYNL